MKRIGILTSGGDAPGMNAVIRSVVRYGMYHKLKVVGVLRGYEGLINGNLKPLDYHSVLGILNRGGTILETARCDEFFTEEGQGKAVDVIKRNNIDALIVVGGDGTYQGANCLHKRWNIPCIGIPATIDNDIKGTDTTIGADTAINTTLEAIDRIRDTAMSMRRIFVVEVMGRDSGFIAINAALGSAAEDVLVPELKFNIEEMCQNVIKRNTKGKVIIVSEGVMKAEDIAEKIANITGLETRAVVLGHTQRGGKPSAQDRILAVRLGVAALDLILKGEFGKAVGIQNGKINAVDLSRTVGGNKMESFYRLIRILGV